MVVVAILRDGVQISPCKVRGHRDRDPNALCRDGLRSLWVVSTTVQTGVPFSLVQEEVRFSPLDGVWRDWLGVSLLCPKSCQLWVVRHRRLFECRYHLRVEGMAQMKVTLPELRGDG